MIGRSLKKYSTELGFKISHGVAYGKYKNYIVTLHEGVGWKAAGIAVSIADAVAVEKIKEVLSDTEFNKQYSIQQINITQDLIEIIFLDHLGTMKKLKPALDAIFHKLSENQVQGADYCSRCKNAFNGNHCQIIKVGNYVYGMHDACANSIENSMLKNNNDIKKGSVGGGVIGATIGAVVGAIPWAVAYYFGWFVGWLGFLIGLAAKKGYEIFKGRETKIKAAVIIIVTMLAVVLAEYATCLFTCFYQFKTDPEFDYNSFSLGQVFSILNYAIVENNDLLVSMIIDVALGWLFAGLGIYSTIKNIFAETSPKHPVFLDDPSNQ